MVQRIKTVLVTQYIGAIVIGLLGAHGVTSLIGTVVQPVTMYLGDKAQRRSGLSFGLFSWDFAIIPSVISAILHFLVAYMLLRWLYLQEGATHAVAAEDTSAAEGGD